VIDKKNAKYQYLLAFILGMALMVIFYVFFEVTTDSAYRTRTNTTTGEITVDTPSVDITLTSSTTEETISVSLDTNTITVYMGVEALDIDDIMVSQLGLKNSDGVLVNSVISGSPAYAADIERGDVLTALDGQGIEDVATFKEVMATFSAGDNIRVNYVRDGKKGTLYVELAGVNLPEAVTDATTVLGSDTSSWGVSLSQLNSGLSSQYSIPDNISGVMILSVEEASPADEAGLSVGDVITGVDRIPVEDMDDLFNAIAEDDNSTALLDIFSGGSMRYVPLDATSIQIEIATEQDTTFLGRIFTLFTGGMPFGDEEEEEEEEGPKGGKFAPEEDEEVVLTASDETAWNRPEEPPGTDQTSSSSSSTSDSSDTALNRPSSVPSSSGSTNDTVLFIGLLILVILYLSYREYHRPTEG
jgi:C-terminal processing protease CtpA/Prc